MRNAVILLCAGSGQRMGALPGSKTLLEIGGVPAVVRCVRTFSSLDLAIVLVCRAEEEDTFRGTLRLWGCEEVLFAAGGASRAQSVANGLLQVPEGTPAVLIHDGARPLFSRDLAQRALRSALLYGSGVPALPVTDTLKRGKDGRIAGTVDRTGLYRVQTPQAFRTDWLRDAFRRLGSRVDTLTDDAAVLEEAGYSVRLVEGESRNLKITYPEDCSMAQLFASGSVTVGFGMDAHRLVPGRRLVLCGVEIPWEKGLDGHSDADAAVHALMDAMLGAASMGDIGKLFPDTDERYRGISSLVLLRECAKRLGERGYTLTHADITIVCQQPRLAPYIPQMSETLAREMSLSPAQISVKATTTEHMGYEGRGEGISAYAAATVSRDTLSCYSPDGKTDNHNQREAFV